MTTPHTPTPSRSATGGSGGALLLPPRPKSQTDRVLRLLLDRWDGITSLDAIRELGCTRLAARIADLKAEGHDIRSEMVSVENRDGQKVRVARYRIAA